MAMVLALVGASAMFALRELKRNRPLSSNPKALKLFVQADYPSQRMTLEGTLQAFTNLTEAVKLDPQFLDAYLTLAVLNFRGWPNELPPHHNMTANFRWAADKIRGIDPDSPQYHTVNSFIKCQEWHFDDAIDEITLARRSYPKFGRPPEHMFYAWLMLRARGDAETALREFRAAERIQPADIGIQIQLGTPYYFKRDFPKAIEQYQKALQLEPRVSGPHGLLGQAYEADKQYDKALAEYEAEEKLLSGDAAKTEAKYKRWRSVLAQTGPREMWQAMLDEARQSPSPDHYGMARLCARLGYANEVFLLLNQAYQEHNGGMFNLLIDDCWDTLRDDAGYNELLGKMGFSKVLPARK